MTHAGALTGACSKHGNNDSGRHMKITRREFTASTGLLVAATHPLTSALATAASAISEPIVETTYGKVRGVVKDGVYSFKGIPYGASTTGANRFMPPQKPVAWSGIRDCLEWGPLAPQPASSGLNPASGMGKDFATFFGTQPDSPSSQSEDCLTLNILRPD
jgi:para-nitrobenzyl esterase